MISEEKLAFLEEFYAGEDPQERVSWRLLLSGEDATDYVEEMTYGPSEDAPGHILEATLVGFPVAVIEQDDVSVDLFFGDVAENIRVKDFRGKVFSAVSEGQVMELIAATGARWQPETLLLQNTEYSGYYPSTAMHDALSRLRDYYAAFEIPTLRKPIFNRKLKADSDDRFDYLNTIQDVLKAIEEESGLVELDSEENVAVGYKESPLDEAGEPSRLLVVGEDIDRPFRPEPTTEGRYSHVEVYERDENGGYIPLASAPITYHDPKIKPPRYAPLTLESTDDTPEKYAVATERARKEANKRSYGEWKASFTMLSVDPRVRRTATVEIEDTDPATRITTRWRAILRTHKRDPMDQTTEVSAVLTREKVTLPKPELPGGEEVALEVGMPAFGVDHLQKGYVDTRLAWAWVDGNAIVIDTDAAAPEGVVFSDTLDPAISEVTF